MSGRERERGGRKRERESERQRRRERQGKKGRTSNSITNKITIITIIS